MVLRICTILAVIATTRACSGQTARAQPVEGRGQIAPFGGNVLINNQGLRLKTDPDQGVGYSYHSFYDDGLSYANGLYPALVNRSAAQFLGQQELGITERPGRARLEATKNVVRAGEELSGVGDRVTSARHKLTRAAAEERSAAAQQLQAEQDRMQAAQDDFVRAVSELMQAERLITDAAMTLELGQQFDATKGIKNHDLSTLAPAEIRALRVDGTTADTLNHQPLIQIKARVIEVNRLADLQVQSVLEYISRDPTKVRPTFTSGAPLNDNPKTRNLRGLTGFTNAGLINSTNSGAGLLVNLTSEHINYIASLLATELNADLITAPEVVTTNGQNVEFVSGDRVPFALGQSVIQGSAASVQQFFYKHVGAYISVTPRIVNWGLDSKNRGSADIKEIEQCTLEPRHVTNWPGLLCRLKSFEQSGLATEIAVWSHLPETTREQIRHLTPTERVGEVLKLEIVTSLGTVFEDRIDNRQFLESVFPHEITFGPCCKWRANNCTVELSIVVRLSGATDDISLSGDFKGKAEGNVRAIANVIQVQSGHGVVMGGLIGEADVEAIDKVPVLGDIPVIGFLFRSKVTNRQKSETLVFVEASVLDPDPEIARQESYGDFVLGKDYVAGEFLQNPLEEGMCRMGFGTYLPPLSHSEARFWDRVGRKVLRASATIDDAVE